MLISLLSTKFYIPPTRANAVKRPRLTEKLLSILERPGSFALLSGPAGFGKTTLLSEFATQLQQPVAWVSLDDGDNDPIRFWTYLIAACQTVQPGAGESAMALFRLPQPPALEAIPAILINDLAGPGRDMVLILDDYHTIQNQAIHAGFLFLLEHLPVNLHIVVSTRIDPPWPLARFRARNQLVEIRARDLRFTTEEAASFLNRIMGLSLLTQDVAALEERTEGWVAGLQLAALSMQGRSDIAGFVKALTGSHVYIAEYLVEEVLQRQPEDVQAFLLQTSILERLNAGLCEALTGCEDGQSRLAALHRMNLFVISLDDEGRWFRYHHLFADLLKARLRQTVPADTIAELHRSAAAWYEQAGMAPEAIEHALAAADYSHAVQLVTRIALTVILQAYVNTVEGWLQAIPPKYIEQSPRANMAFVWLNLLRGTFAQAAPYLERLEAFFSTQQAGSADPSLEGEWLAIQSKMLNLQGKPAESRDLANRGLEILPEADAPVRSMLYANLAAAYQQVLDYDHAAEAFQRIVQDAQAAGDYFMETLGVSGQVQMVLQLGRLRRAFVIASEEIQRVEASGKSIPFSATLYGEVGQIYYYWHQLEQSKEYQWRSMQTSGRSGYIDPELYYHVMLSRIFQMEANWDASAREMQKAGELMQAAPPVMVREEVLSQQVRVHLAFDRLSAAQAVLQPEGFSFEGAVGFPALASEPGEPARPVTRPVGLLYNSALRVLLYKGRTKQDRLSLEQGLDLAAGVLAGELQSGEIPTALETLLLRSQMYAALGNEQDSLAEADRALELAEPEGFISIFVEEGQPVAGILAALLERGSPETVQPDRILRISFIRRILDAFPGKGSPQATQGKKLAANTPPAGEAVAGEEPLAPVEPLTARELEILQLIAAGDSNRAIAERLIITVSAVKKHASNILGKLGASSRTQAVARARQAGIL
ncbi:MAG: LuxR C-terminal-related transcriptional regulator [Omnitrophica WOR_2 bacterium]